MRHIFASISFQSKYIFHEMGTVLDIGTGGGLPGVPLAILRPDIHFTLVDSIQKKIRALEDIVSRLNIKNVSIVCGRAEELSKRKKYFHHFEYVIARAVAPIKDIIQWTKPFLVDRATIIQPRRATKTPTYIERGSIVLLKGGDLSNEIEEANIKHNPKEISIYPIIVKGLEETDLIDKKLVIVKP